MHVFYSVETKIAPLIDFAIMKDLECLAVFCLLRRHA